MSVKWIAILALLGACSSSHDEDDKITFTPRDDASLPDSGTELPDAGEAPDGPTAPAPGEIGSECASDDDCPSGGCLTDFPGGYCSQECDGLGSCPDGSECIDTGDGTFCFQKCDPDAVACRAGYGCATSFQLDENICIPGCEHDSDCGEGFGCDPMGGDLEEGRCFDRDATIGVACEDDSQCPEASICATEAQTGWPGGACTSFECDPDSGEGCGEGSTCLAAGGGAGLCVPSCASASDCREGYSCDEGVCTSACTEDSQCSDGRVCNTGLGICNTPFDPAQLGGACSRRSGCDGGECLSEFGSGFGFGYCSYAGCEIGVSGSCPGDGVCAEATDGSGLCLDGCTADTDCRAGYACKPSDSEVADSPKACLPACASEDHCSERTDCNEGTGRCGFPFDPEWSGQECTGSGDFRECPGGRCVTEVPGGMCVAIGCRVSGEGLSEPCPENTACVDDGAGDPTLGYCLPSCTDDAGCRDGYTCAIAEGATSGVCRAAD